MWYQKTLTLSAKSRGFHLVTDEILNQLADMVGMTPVSFSRFFKLRTGKNLSDYIIDIRLGFAARLSAFSRRISPYVADNRQPNSVVIRVRL